MVSKISEEEKESDSLIEDHDAFLNCVCGVSKTEISTGIKDSDRPFHFGAYTGRNAHKEANPTQKNPLIQK